MGSRFPGSGVRGSFWREGKARRKGPTAGPETGDVEGKITSVREKFELGNKWETGTCNRCWKSRNLGSSQNPSGMKRDPFLISEGHFNDRRVAERGCGKNACR